MEFVFFYMMDVDRFELYFRINYATVKLENEQKQAPIYR